VGVVEKPEGLQLILNYEKNRFFDCAVAFSKIQNAFLVIRNLIFDFFASEILRGAVEYAK
jgi:hypothetical protein